MTIVNQSRPRAGHENYVDGLPGFYAVNPDTNISNYPRYRQRDGAERTIAHVKAQYPGEPCPLVVVEIGAPDA